MSRKSVPASNAQQAADEFLQAQTGGLPPSLRQLNSEAREFLHAVFVRVNEGQKVSWQNLALFLAEKYQSSLPESTLRGLYQRWRQGRIDFGKEKP